MTVIGALSSFRKRREMSPHKRAYGDRRNCYQADLSLLESPALIPLVCWRCAGMKVIGHFYVQRLLSSDGNRRASGYLSMRYARARR
jgi:hypothetical protein